MSVRPLPLIGICLSLLLLTVPSRPARAQQTRAQAQQTQPRPTKPRVVSGPPAKAPFPIYRGGRLDGGSAPGGTSPAASDARRDPSAPPPIPRPQATALIAAAEELAGDSFDAFRRGLMPLEDHVEQLDLARRIELRCATTPDEQAAALNRYATRIDRVVTALEEFSERFLTGWTADIALARMLQAATRAQLAELNGQPDLANEAHGQALELAARHLAERLEESRQGLSTVPFNVFTPLPTAVITDPDPFRQPSPEEFLADPIGLSRLWSLRAASLGIADRETLEQYDAARLNMQVALAEGQTEAAAAALAQARTAAETLYRQQREFFDNGTATLFDLSRAWRLARDLDELIEGTPLSPDAAPNAPAGRPGPIVQTGAGAGQAADDPDARRFSDLLTLAGETEDLRGRIDSDVKFVTLWSEFRKAETAARQAAEQNRSITPPTPSAPPAPAAGGTGSPAPKAESGSSTPPGSAATAASPPKPGPRIIELRKRTR